MIRSIRIPQDIAQQYGLRAPDEPLRGLGKLVVLAGPNGAGKTRYISLTQNLCGTYLRTPRLLKELETRAKYLNSQLVSYARHALASNAKRLEPHQVATVTSERNQIEEQLKSVATQISALPRMEIDLSDATEQNFVTLTYLVGKGSIILHGQLTPDQSKNMVEQTKSVGFASALTGMHAFFSSVAAALWNRDHPRARDKERLMSDAAEAERFNELLDKLVGGRIEPDTDEANSPIPLFRGRVFNPHELSDGEAILVTWAIILHRQKDRLSNTILVIDEPENHLHPDACIKALAALLDILGPDGQIWVATHAIQIISFAGMDAVWLVDDGCIEYGGNKVDVVMDRLLGGRDGRDRLRTFLDDADELAFHKFAAECLTRPGVAPHKEKDAQEAQFGQVLERRKAEGRSFHILDYGAGKGRLAKALFEARRRSEGASNFAPISYHAYNGPQSSTTEIDECRRHIEELRAGAGVEQAVYLDDIRKFEIPAVEKMDLVVLCNVLHEIPVRDWERVFQQIALLLGPEGTVLVMEDQRMTVGELPSAHGFVVLDEIEVAALFNVEPGKGVRVVSSVQGKRLLAIEIEARILNNISKTTIDCALGIVMSRAESKVQELRSRDDKTFRTGREHAYYAMLYMNAKLAR